MSNYICEVDTEILMFALKHSVNSNLYTFHKTFKNISQNINSFDDDEIKEMIIELENYMKNCDEQHYLEDIIKFIDYLYECVGGK